MREVIRGCAPAVMQPPVLSGRGRSQARKMQRAEIFEGMWIHMARKKLHREPVLKDWAEVNDALRSIHEYEHALTAGHSSSFILRSTQSSGGTSCGKPYGISLTGRYLMKIF